METVWFAIVSVTFAKLSLPSGINSDWSGIDSIRYANASLLSTNSSLLSANASLPYAKRYSGGETESVRKEIDSLSTSKASFPSAKISLGSGIKSV
jgi:hypothetical protein